MLTNITKQKNFYACLATFVQKNVIRILNRTQHRKSQKQVEKKLASYITRNENATSNAIVIFNLLITEVGLKLNDSRDKQVVFKNSK